MNPSHATKYDILKHVAHRKSYPTPICQQK